MTYRPIIPDFIIVSLSKKTKRNTQLTSCKLNNKHLLILALFIIHIQLLICILLKNEMKKSCKNEQTNSSCSDDDCIHHGSLSVFKNKVGNEKAKREVKPLKFRAYHPKMMIAYRGMI